MFFGEITYVNYRIKKHNVMNWIIFNYCKKSPSWRNLCRLRARSIGRGRSLSVSLSSITRIKHTLIGWCLYWKKKKKKNFTLNFIVSNSCLDGGYLNLNQVDYNLSLICSFLLFAYEIRFTSIEKQDCSITKRTNKKVTMGRRPPLNTLQHLTVIPITTF